MSIGSKRKNWRAQLFFKQRGLCIWCANPMQMERPRDPDYATYEHIKRRRHRRD